MKPTKNKIELALHWLRELRPDWQWKVVRIGPTNITITGELRLIAPGSQMFWMTPPWMSTETIDVFGTHARVTLTLEHADAQMWNETAPEMVKFLANDN